MTFDAGKIYLFVLQLEIGNWQLEDIHRKKVILFKTRLQITVN